MIVFASRCDLFHPVHWYRWRRTCGASDRPLGEMEKRWDFGMLVAIRFEAGWRGPTLVFVLRETVSQGVAGR
jgi:hypothetical protein